MDLDREPTRILLITRNLMTRVQLESRWKGLGAIVTQKPQDPVDLIVLDLGQDDALALTGSLKRQHPAARLIAFGPHVDGEAFRQARAAGVDECVARGSVMEKVASRMTGY